METKSRPNVIYILAALLIVAGLITAILGENDPASVPVMYSSDESIPSDAFSVELDFALKDLDENEVTITQFENQVRVVNFWATWCGPCVEEIPDFQAFHEKYGDQGVKVIGIALDKEGADIVRPFVEEMDMTYLTLIDTDGMSAAKFGGVYGIPTTFIIDREGTVRNKRVGMMSYENLETAVLPLLAQ
ncbi:MAG: TlpA disulfide reductase family protein [Gemmatimonadetes bacterium]|nr:TlpA disulfide reductase family protein [Gemmatimonadota bacterium]